MHKWIALALIACLLQGSTPDESLREGMDYALFFAVNEYDSESLTDLKNPIQNAKDIAKELKDNYGFQTEVVENPTLEQITNKLKIYAQRFSNNFYNREGQLLLFFSGHGIEEYDNGFFLPKDANLEKLYETAFGYGYWRNRIDMIDCKHTLVIVDACHSITFAPNWKTRVANKDPKRIGELNDKDKLLQNHRLFKARYYFTSDGKGHETPDRSSFAKKILEGLRTHYSSDVHFSSDELFVNYIKKSTPIPGGGEFGSDEAASSFFFFRKPLSFSYKTIEKDNLSWETAKKENTIIGYKSYLARFPNGEFRLLAQKNLKHIETIDADFKAWEQAKQQNTEIAYGNYLRMQPNGMYRDIASHNIQEQKSTPKKHYVVAGTFRADYNAKARAKQVKEKGFPNVEVIKFDNPDYYAVCVDKFVTELDARALVKTLQANHINSYVRSFF